MSTVYGSVVSSGYFKGYMTYTTKATETTFSVTVSAAGPKSTANSSSTWGSWRLTMSATDKSTSYKPSSSGTTSHSLSPGSSWDMLGSSKTYTWEKGTGTKTVKVSAKTYWNGGGSSTASQTWTIPSLKSYTISYNSNGGSGAPNSQTKYYGNKITLRSTTPTRSGYTFKSWNTKSSGSGTTYKPGSTYSSNASVTLYAQWTKDYTVSYNANGGSGAPSNQTKKSGVTLTLSSTKPTKSGYIFRGWAKSSSATSPQYYAGGKYSENASVTLYAVWSTVYDGPEISIGNATSYRCDSEGQAVVSGDYVKYEFQWQASTGPNLTNRSTQIDIEYDNGETPITITSSDESGTVERKTDFTIDPGEEVTINITITDLSTGIPSGSDTSNSYKMSLAKGGYAVHISEDEQNVTLFGIAEQDKDGLNVNSDLRVSGDIVISGHDTRVGWSQDYKLLDVSVPHNTSTYTKALSVTLSKGTYILIGHASFQTNATGRRVLKWGYGNVDLAHTLVSQPAVSGTTTRMQCIAIAATKGDAVTYTLCATHNAGSGTTLSTDFRLRIARIA